MESVGPKHRPSQLTKEEHGRSAVPATSGATASGLLKQINPCLYALTDSPILDSSLVQIVKLESNPRRVWATSRISSAYATLAKLKLPQKN